MAQRNNYEPQADNRHDTHNTAMLIDGYWSYSPGVNRTDENRLSDAKAELIGHLKSRIAKIERMTLAQFNSNK